MSTPLNRTERFAPDQHDVAAFRCGNESLDRWLARYAGQSERRDAARTFVMADDAGRVFGFYTLVVGELEHDAAIESVRKGMSRHFPIPIAILARLAVDQREQGRGTGRALLNDALSRVCVAAAQVAIRAVVVHAIDDPAAAFYARFGFRALSASPRTLMVTLAELHAAGYP